MSETTTPAGPTDALTTPDTPAQAVPIPASRRSRGALTVGLGLVVFGTLLLIEQFVPGMDLWRWWPLIVLAVGVRQLFGPARGAWTVRHLGEGLTTIAFGLVLLAQMLGMVRWDVWFSILRLWPALIVALGFEILGKGARNEWVRLLGSLVIVAALTYGAFVMTPTRGWPPNFTNAEAAPFDQTVKHDDRVREGEALVIGAAGELTVSDGEDLVHAEGTSPYAPAFDVDTRGRKAAVEIGPGEGSWGPTLPATDVSVSLDRDVVWDLEVRAGVSSYEIDARDLALTSLVLESGVSDGLLVLGDPGAADLREGVPVDVDAGVSALTIRVPRGTDARVVVREGLTGIESDGQWAVSRESGRRTYESDGFTGDGPYWEIGIDAGVGSITLGYY